MPLGYVPRVLASPLEILSKTGGSKVSKLGITSVTGDGVSMWKRKPVRMSLILYRSPNASATNVSCLRVG
ncbi:hypothetical protein DPMN_111492 [Dreissena polymorpha]|uniref:Uncharacterized protein n=1 Tax=Dreissena polymorpha TaxID=45954 RepID=A0A9D4KED1_DREPO|nr:hypothetical protein DPMN_111492 [Dreissena polymorpha]